MFIRWANPKLYENNIVTYDFRKYYIQQSDKDHHMARC
jgi:hypothetical protein